MAAPNQGIADRIAIGLDKQGKDDGFENLAVEVRLTNDGGVAQRSATDFTLVLQDKEAEKLAVSSGKPVPTLTPAPAPADKAPAVPPSPAAAAVSKSVSPAHAGASTSTASHGGSTPSATPSSTIGSTPGSAPASSLAEKNAEAMRRFLERKQKMEAAKK